MMDRPRVPRSPLSRFLLAGAMTFTYGVVSWVLPWTSTGTQIGGAPAADALAAYPGTWPPVVDGGGAQDLQPPPTSGSAPGPGSTSAGTTAVPGPAVTAGSVHGIPVTVLDAYQRAAERGNRLEPACRLPWQLLAAIGKVESGHAENGDVDATGRVRHPILGPVLDGSNGTATIANSDAGKLDGVVGPWARAVGPMQFIPSTWAEWGVDVLGTGVLDPENVYDATAAAADYLCAHGRDLSTPDGMSSAILSYNNSARYLTVVLDWYRAYSSSAVPVADRSGGAAPGGSPAPGGQAGTSQPGLPGPAPATSAPGPASSGPSGTPAPSATGDAPTSSPTSSPAPGAPPDPVGGLLGGVGAVTGGLLGAV